MADAGYSLHQCAVDAEAALEKLATEMAHAGLPPQTVQPVSQMAGVVRKLVSALGKGQEQTGDHQPAPPEAQPRSIGEATDHLHQTMMASAQQRQA